VRTLLTGLWLRRMRLTVKVNLEYVVTFGSAIVRNIRVNRVLISLHV